MHLEDVMEPVTRTMRRFDEGGGNLAALWGAALAWILNSSISGFGYAAEPVFDRAIEQDWALQEQRLGRTAGQPEALRAVSDRIERLWRVRVRELGLDAADQKELCDLRGELSCVDSLDATMRLALYHRARWFARELALSSPRFSGRPMVFMKRHRFVCQMLHEYMGYFHDYGDVWGGGIYRLEKPGRSQEITDLVRGRLPKGNYTTLALSGDATKAYFAFAERASSKPSFHSADRRGFNIFEIDVASGALRRLTDGPEDDFDPCPLPDGGIAFISTRRGGFARCNNPWEPCASYTLHRMGRDGDGIRTLSFHETAEWHPSVLHDGRIVYIRWDYVDRSAANFHGLWAAHPDGSGAVSLFGNYTMRINACYQPRAIPGSRRIVFVAGAHHANVGGALVLLDPARAALDPTTGEDDLGSLEVLTPEVCFPEAAGWPKSYFHGPQPLCEDEYLVGFSFEPLPGMSTGQRTDTPTGIYYFDRHGSLELLYRDSGISCMYPLLLTPAAPGRILADTADAGLAREAMGEFLLADVGRSLMALPPNRRVTELRVYQILPKAGSHRANDPRIGHANAENARMLLGSVPVESDGSAYFRVPAQKPLYFQAVDAGGRAVQGMRSIVYLQPGERRSCVGCHEPGTAAAPDRYPIAARRPASGLRPGPKGTLPFSFPLLVQPVLDANCVRCHDGLPGEGKSALALTGGKSGDFSESYQNLKKYLRWHEWGDASISHIATRPGKQGADESPLTAVLDDGHHRQNPLPEQARRTLYLWLDANAPFFGTYDKAEQAIQLTGGSIEPQALQ